MQKKNESAKDTIIIAATVTATPIPIADTLDDFFFYKLLSIEYGYYGGEN